MKTFIKTVFVFIAILSGYRFSFGQDSLQLSLSEAIKRGVDSSRTTLLDENEIENAINQIEQAKDKQLPAIKASYMASKAFIPTHTINIPGLTKDPVELPKAPMLYLGTASVEQAIFAGNRLQYAKESARLLEDVQRLNKAHNKEGIMEVVINAYFNLFKIDQNVRIVRRNIADIDQRIKETNQFKEEGLATENDVLRFELEKSQANLTLLDLQKNRAIANYALLTLLKLPDDITLRTEHLSGLPEQEKAKEDVLPLAHFLEEAMNDREDLKVFEVEKRINDTQVKSINAGKLPTLGAGINSFYINPGKSFFPKNQTYLFSSSLGLTLSWDISSFYTTKNKLSQARIQRQRLEISKDREQDQVKVDVNKKYQEYLESLDRIKELKTAIAQAKENDRVMELKFRNQLASTTDRIDAETMLYSTLINYGLAKADASIAWYDLLTVSGMIDQIF